MLAVVLVVAGGNFAPAQHRGGTAGAARSADPQHGGVGRHGHRRAAGADGADAADDAVHHAGLHDRHGAGHHRSPWRACCSRCSTPGSAGTRRYKQVLAVVTHAGAISISATLFTLPLNYARESLSGATNLGVFAPFLDEGSLPRPVPRDDRSVPRLVGGRAGHRAGRACTSAGPGRVALSLLGAYVGIAAIIAGHHARIRRESLRRVAKKEDPDWRRRGGARGRGGRRELLLQEIAGRHRSPPRHVKARDLEAIVSASGKIQAKRFVNMSAVQMGRVTRLAVEEGDRVKAGQFLLQIDPNILRGIGAARRGGGRRSAVRARAGAGRRRRRRARTCRSPRTRRSASASCGRKA